MAAREHLSRLDKLDFPPSAVADLSSVLRSVLDGVIELQGADLGTVQLLNSATGQLQIAARGGLSPELLDEHADASAALASSRALHDRERVIVQNVETDLAFAPHRATAAASGFHGLQATPLLVRRTGAPLGILLTQFRRTYQPTDRELHLTDVYARLAADVTAFRFAERSLQTLEEALRDSEGRLQAAVDLLGLGLYSWDPMTNALVWDARVKAIWGLPPDGRTDYDLWLHGVHPDDRAAVLAALERCIDPDHAVVYQDEYRVTGVDGVERWAATRGRTTFVDRQPVSFRGIALDITARKHAEELLAKSEARLASILDQLPAGVGLYDLDGRLIQSNTILRHYIATAMIPPHETTTARWRAMMPDGSLIDQSEYPWNRAQCGELVVPGIDFVHTADDGRETWMRMSAGPFRDQTDNIVGVVTVLQDIDEQKRSELALRESDERLRQFANHSSQVLWILGADMQSVEYLSPACESIWGKPHDTTSESWIDAIFADDRDSVAAARQKAKQGEPVVHRYRIIRTDETVRWVRETMFPIRDHHGRVQRIGGIAQDVTGSAAAVVYIVDADEAHRQGLLHLFQQTGYGTKAFISGADVLEMAPVLAAGCLVLHANPRVDALAVLKQLKARGSALPVIVIGESDGNVAIAVEAMKAGAADWLEAPYPVDKLLTTVAAALANVRMSVERDREADWARARIAGMSERERQVLEGLLAGGTNKMIGRKLGISPRTVEMHRASVMEQLRARTLPEAVLKAAAAGFRLPPSSKTSQTPPR